MAFPDILRQYQMNIRKDLEAKGLNVVFEITNYNHDAMAIEYSLYSKNPNEEVPKEAQKIVDDYMQSFRQFVSRSFRKSPWG